MKIFDSKSKKKVELIPIKEGKLGIYVCGPTVYDGPHLGHGRSAVCFDLIRKYFIFKGYDVTFVSNYTDIDDKMINRAKEEGMAVSELAEKVIPLYIDQYAKLGIDEPDSKPKATDHIESIIEIIKTLEDKELTYVLDDGVYFDVSLFPKYGDLSKQNLEELKMGARVEVKEEKRNPYDFVLWKFKKEGEPFWPSPWGDGRPGWHIECSAMSFKHLGEQFDIHGGGLDLLFPHHECEVAQSVGAFGDGQFAKYWIHNGFINVDDEKMSKSLGNFFTLSDIFEKYDPMAVRLLYIQTHYRNPINFTDDLLNQATAALNRIHDFIRNLNNLSEDGAENNELPELLELTEKKFIEFMDDDFDSSGALGVIFDLIKSVNILLKEGKLSKKDVGSVIQLLKKIDAVLGVIFFEEELLPEDIDDLIKQREQARADKNFELADKIRDDLKEKNIILDDTPQGTVWKKLK